MYHVVRLSIFGNAYFRSMYICTYVLGCKMYFLLSVAVKDLKVNVLVDVTSKEVRNVSPSPFFERKVAKVYWGLGALHIEFCWLSTLRVM